MLTEQASFWFTRVRPRLAGCVCGSLLIRWVNAWHSTGRHSRPYGWNKIEAKVSIHPCAVKSLFKLHVLILSAYVWPTFTAVDWSNGRTWEQCFLLVGCYVMSLSVAGVVMSDVLCYLYWLSDQRVRDAWNLIWRQLNRKTDAAIHSKQNWKRLEAFLVADET